MRYYLLGNQEEIEGQFPLNHVFGISDRDVQKRGKLERIATLGMASKNFSEEESQEFKYSFRIEMVVPNLGEDGNIIQSDALLNAVADIEAEPEPEAAAAPEPEPEPEADDGKKKKLGSKALGFAKKNAKKAQEKAQAAAAQASQAVQDTVTGADLAEDDLRSIMRGKLIGGIGDLKVCPPGSQISIPAWVLCIS